MINIVLSGGSGTRLWPLSRRLEPKQYYKLINNHSLFQETVLRNKDYCQSQFVILGAENYFMAADQLEELNINNPKYLLEPVGRNTAPAIALVCFAMEPEDVIVITPSDQMIKDMDSYYKSLDRASELAKENYLVTFGINPAYPETGFGYIEADGENVLKFHEKPKRELAEEYIRKGNYYWNSGIFVFKAGVYLEELKKYCPEIYEQSKIAITNAKNNITEENIIKISLEDMQNIPDESIDIAVMEKSTRVKVVPASFSWSDLGSFDSLYDILPKDENNSTLIGNFHTLATNKSIDTTSNINLDAKNNLIFSSNRTIVAVDIEDLIIVDTPDALLVTKKGSSQRVKEVVQRLKEEESVLHNIHLTAHRPWGTYTVLEEAERYKMKKIIVKPGKRLSLQKHYHRNEHWVVVSGTANVTVGSEEKVIKANESIFIPMGELHRLENPGKIPLIMIEVQVGEYLGEDDIVRFEDDFKRV